jgi:hypothetical protein
MSRWYGAISAGVERRPAVAAGLAILFEHVLVVGALLELGHLRERLLDGLEEVEHGFAPGGHFELAVDVGGNPEVVAQRGVVVHQRILSSGPARAERGRKAGRARTVTGDTAIVRRGTSGCKPGKSLRSRDPQRTYRERRLK